MRRGTQVRLLLLIPFIVARGVFWIGYTLSWRLLRPLVWHGGPQKAHERSMIVLGWCDNHSWTWPILKAIHILAYGMPREWETWFGIDWSKYDL